MAHKIYTTIFVKLKANVLNPRGHVDGMMGREEYFLATKGEEVRFTFVKGEEKNAKLGKVVDAIMAGEKFPLCYGTRRQAWADKFDVIDKEDWMDDEPCDD